MLPIFSMWIWCTCTKTISKWYNNFPTVCMKQTNQFCIHKVLLLHVHEDLQISNRVCMWTNSCHCCANVMPDFLHIHESHVAGVCPILAKWNSPFTWVWSFQCAIWQGFSQFGLGDNHSKATDKSRVCCTKMIVVLVLLLAFMLSVFTVYIYYLLKICIPLWYIHFTNFAMIKFSIILELSLHPCSDALSLPLLGKGWLSSNELLD